MENPQRQEKFEELFRTMFPKVRAFAAKLLCSQDDAEDIAQDIFVKLWDCPEKWEDKSAWSGYIYTITRNRILDFIRHRFVEDGYLQSAGYWKAENADTGDIIHENLYAKEIEMLTMLVVRNMPEQRRKVFCMSRMENLSNSEIAERLGLSVRTVERHIHLALSDLKNVLAAFCLLLLGQ